MAKTLELTAGRISVDNSLVIGGKPLRLPAEAASDDSRESEHAVEPCRILARAWPCSLVANKGKKNNPSVMLQPQGKG